jgi:hypothetical protein
MPEGDPDSLIDVPDTHEDPPVQGKDTRVVPFRELERERRIRRDAAKAAADAKTEADALRARLAEIEADRDKFKTGHDAWTKAQDEARNKATETIAARLALLPEDLRAELETEIEGGMDPAAALRQLDRLDKVRGATPAAEPAKPQHPTGGRAATGTPAADDLSPEIKKWVEARRPDLIGVNPATVRKMYDKFSGAK